MLIDQIVLPLLRVPLFAGLSAQRIKRLALAGERMELPDGAVVIADGQPGEAAFLVLAGELTYTGGADDQLIGEVLGAGTLVGELAMLVETTHASTLVATGPVVLLRFSRQALLEAMQEDLGLAEHFADVLRQRLARLAVALRHIDSQITAPLHGQLH
jgi:CRP-like cAMP-binding protein